MSIDFNEEDSELVDRAATAENLKNIAKFTSSRKLSSFKFIITA